MCFDGTTTNVAGLVLAAGKGTRMKSKFPKVMHELLGIPILGHVLTLLDSTGIKDVIVVVGHGADVVGYFARESGSKVAVQDIQKGTAHAVLAARHELEQFDGDVLILCGDTPLLKPGTLSGFLAAHRSSGAIISILSANFSDPTGYGRIVRRRDDPGSVQAIIEERDATDEQRGISEINTGSYLCNSQFLFDALGEIGCDNAQGEYYLTDIVELAVKKGKNVKAVCSASEEEALGINSRMDLARAERILLNRLLNRWMSEGVTFELAESIYLEPKVKLERDVVIGPHSVLKGDTVVKKGAVIGAFSYLEDVTVEAGVTIPPYSILKKDKGLI